MNRRHTATFTLVSGIAVAAMATAGPTKTPTEAAQSSWEQTVLFEPCMNGEVSAGGLYPSQAAENKSRATMGYLARKDG